MNLINYNNLIQQFKDIKDLIFIKLLRIYKLSPDILLHKIETSEGLRYIYMKQISF